MASDFESSEERQHPLPQTTCFLSYCNLVFRGVCFGTAHVALSASGPAHVSQDSVLRCECEYHLESRGETVKIWR